MHKKGGEWNFKNTREKKGKGKERKRVMNNYKKVFNCSLHLILTVYLVLDLGLFTDKVFYFYFSFPISCLSITIF